MRALAADARVQHLAQESRHLTLVRLDLLRDVHTRVDMASLGYSHRDDFAREELGISASAWRTSLRLSRALENLPCARTALERGWIGESRLLTVLPELSVENEAIWIARAIRWPVAKLSVLTRHARRQRIEATGSTAATATATTDCLDPADAEASVATAATTDCLNLADLEKSAAARLAVVIGAPAVTALRYRSFTEDVSRRVGLTVSPGRALEVALSEFRSHISPREWECVELRREWPPRFLGDASGPGSLPRGFRVDLDDSRYVYVPPGTMQTEAMPRWLANDLADHPLSERRWSPFRHAKVELPGVEPEQTDGATFVRDVPPASYPHVRRLVTGGFAVDDDDDVWNSPLITSFYDLYISEQREQYDRDRKDAESARIARRLAEFDTFLAGRGTQATDVANRPSDLRTKFTPDDEGDDGTRDADAEATDPNRSILRHFLEVEARIREIRHEIADALETFRNSDLLTPLGWNGLGDYVEDRLGISLRTAYDWMVTSAGRSRLIKSADSIPSIRSTTLRALVRLERAGANDDCLRLWIERAGETTAKVLDRQVAWALAEIEARPTSRLLGSRAMAPPSWRTWTHVRSTLLRRPDLLGNARFHESVAHEASLQISAADDSIAIGTENATAAIPDDDTATRSADDDARLAHPIGSGDSCSDGPSDRCSDGRSDSCSDGRSDSCGGDIRSDSCSDGRSDSGGDGRSDSCSDGRSDSCGGDIRSDSCGDDRSDSCGGDDRSDSCGGDGRSDSCGVPSTHGRSESRCDEPGIPFDFQIPPDSTPASARIHIRVAPEVLEEFRRAIAILRAAYGSERPVWWCLEALLLHVRRDWISADRDFRRRTAQIAILERDGFQCANPVCTSRREITVHHIQFRSAGGGDDPSNLISLCAACHLQGVHERGSIAVRGSAPDQLTWTVGKIRFEGDWILSPTPQPCMRAAESTTRAWHRSLHAPQPPAGAPRATARKQARHHPPVEPTGPATGEATSQAQATSRASEATRRAS